MPSTAMFPVAPDFNFPDFVNRLSSTYQAKGYYVLPAAYGAGYSIQIYKDMQGFSHILGLGQSIRVNITLSNNTLQVNYCEEEWTSKILCIAIGWFFCLVPLITGIIGAVGQSGLPTAISSDIQMLTAPNYYPHA